MGERENANELRKESSVIDRRGVVAIITTFVVIGIVVLIGQVFCRNNITDANKKNDK